MALLEVKDLGVEFGAFRAVDNVSLHVDAGEVLGIVGESGSGKSVTALALMGLIDEPGRVHAQRLMFDDRDLLAMPVKERRSLLGKDIAMIFQDPMASLNPCFTVEFQLVETLRIHEGGSRKALRARALELLKQVEIPDAERRLSAYPHQLSGGMSQRVMVAMAIACNPRLLIADEPTTALDVTIQAEILALINELVRDSGMALLMISHDLGVMAQLVSRLLVMYGGTVVESGPTAEVFAHLAHPYTRGLFAARPRLGAPRVAGRKPRLATIPGRVPELVDMPPGCPFADRCAWVIDACRAAPPAPVNVGTSHDARCLRVGEIA